MRKRFVKSSRSKVNWKGGSWKTMNMILRWIRCMKEILWKRRRLSGVYFYLLRLWVMGFKLILWFFLNVMKRVLFFFCSRK